MGPNHCHDLLHYQNIFPGKRYITRVKLISNNENVQYNYMGEGGLEDN